MKRKIAVLTGSRADYGLLYWTIKSIHEDPDLELSLIVTGMHLSPLFGMTAEQIDKDGFPIAARVEMLMASDTADGMATSIGVAIIKMTQVLSMLKPDIMVLLGDRIEVLAAAIAALPLHIPVAHIHGGESTEGAIDESIRHAITKLSHIHFASTELYANNIKQMGEEEWRVHVSGAPGLENLLRHHPPGREEVERHTNLNFYRSTLLVTMHPTTLADPQGPNEIAEVVHAIHQTRLQAIFTYPNADMGYNSIVQTLTDLQEHYEKPIRRELSLGTYLYGGVLRYAAAMVGNSSSGIIEAPTFGLPVVNVGDRQKGRIRGANVIDVPAERHAILAGIHKALTPEFKKIARDSASKSPYYQNERPSEIIVKAIKEVELRTKLLQKRLVFP